MSEPKYCEHSGAKLDDGPKPELSPDKTPREWWINRKPGAKTFAHPSLKAAQQFKYYPDVQTIHLIQYAFYERLERIVKRLSECRPDKQQCEMFTLRDDAIEALRINGGAE